MLLLLNSTSGLSLCVTFMPRKHFLCERKISGHLESLCCNRIPLVASITLWGMQWLGTLFQTILKKNNEICPHFRNQKIIRHFVLYLNVRCNQNSEDNTRTKSISSRIDNIFVTAGGFGCSCLCREPEIKINNVVDTHRNCIYLMASIQLKTGAYFFIQRS